jgi:Tfp pilus assembly protein PilF
VVAAIEDRVAEPAFPSAYFPLTYLSNGALRSNDESMSRQVLLVLKKLQLGENESAIQITQGLQKQYPKHPVPYNLLGLAWQASGDPSRAQAFFQQALAVESNFHPARINLAELELHLGEFVTAHQELNMVLKADNHNRRACLVMAQLYTLEGKPELARKWYSVVSSQL